MPQKCVVKTMARRYGYMVSSNGNNKGFVLRYGSPAPSLSICGFIYALNEHIKDQKLDGKFPPAKYNGKYAHTKARIGMVSYDIKFGAGSIIVEYKVHKQ